jgi:hypothetical protein
MARNRRHWLWLLLLLLAIFLFWHRSERQEHQTSNVSVDSGETAGKSDHPTNVIRIPQGFSPGVKNGTGYFGTGDARLREYDQTLEFLLTGRVTSEQGEPLPGVMVSLHNSLPEFPDYSWPEAIISQPSDAEGRFRIAMMSPVRARISIRKEGFTTKEDMIDFSDQTLIVKSYRLFPAPACVEGYVLDNQEIPIADAAVFSFIFGAPGGSALDAFGFSPPIGRTNSSGKYEIKELPEGPGVSITAKHRGYVSPEAEILNLRAGKCARVDFHLDEGRVFSFCVSNHRGESIPSANAVPEGSNTPEAAVADKDGVVAFTVSPDMTPFECNISAPGYQSKSVRLDPKNSPAEVTLEDGKVYMGKVVNESGEPVADAKVFVTTHNNLKREYALTDKAGRFSLKSGETSVTGFVAYKQGYLEQRMAITDGQPILTGIEICLRKPEGGIFGRVVDSSGIPVRLFNVTFAPGAWKASYFRSYENESGRFSVWDVPAGTFDITFYSVPNSRLERPRSVVIGQLEIRKGYYFGEIMVQFPPLAQKK